MADKETETTEKDDDSKSKSSPTPAQSGNGKNIAVFNGQYYINLNQPLDDYSVSEITAYATGTSDAKMLGFFTVICNPRYTPRTNITKNYKILANSSLPKLIANGRCIMPDGTARYCYIYQDNLGKRLYKQDEGLALGWKTDQVLERILIPITGALVELQKRDVTHGNIRCSNLFSGNSSENNSPLKLGECLSAPASFNQPVIFEPVNRAMASPIGRGEGTIKDDLYALGALMAMHIRNFDPQKGKNDEEIITAKVVNGSYSSLIGSSDRIPSGISDLLRGLLSDNEKMRWSLEDVVDWLDGRRQNANQPVKLKKAARGIAFKGTKFFYARTLAFRMMENQQDAVPLVEGNELMHWLERSVADKDLLQRMELATKAASEGGQGTGYWDKYLPLISIALDVEAPLRYRNLSMHPNAVGNALADAFIQKRGLQNFIEFYNSGIMLFWITIMAEMNVDVSDINKIHDKILLFLKQNNLSSGIERCLYFLNPSIHCLSPLVAEYFATDPKEYLLSLEKAAEALNGNYPDKIIDKHATCFLISRDSRLIEPHLSNLSSSESFRYIIGNLTVLASIQKFNGIGRLPHLTEWICSMIKPVIERYHDSEYQNKVKENIAKKKDNADLSEILILLESPDKIRKDQITYRRAIFQYRELEAEKDTIKKKLAKPKYFAERTGREWAATISGVISTLIIIGFLIIHYTGGAP